MNTDMNPTNAAPPTSPGLDPALLAEPAMWPKVIGIISTVWGTLNIGCGGCGVAGIMMQSSGMMTQAFPDGMPPNFSNPSPMLYVSMAVGLLVSVFLIVAGVALLTRKPIGGMLHIIYAVLGVLTTIGGIFVQLQHQAGIDEWVAQNPNTAFAINQQNSGVFNLIIMVTFSLLALAWPLFCGIWFGLIKRDHSEISRGIESVI